MNLLKVDNLDLHFGEQVLFDDLSLLVSKGDRVCLVGRNGVGKSTLMKALAGEVEPDGGIIWRAATTKVAMLDQELPPADDLSVYDFVALGLGALGKDIAQFHHLSMQTGEADLEALGRVQQRIEAVDGWSAQNRIEQVLTRLKLNGDTNMQSLSGGWRRRVALAQALVKEPDVLLLDEPTNHLDVASIEWLEKQLLEFNGAIVFITHDRAFLQRLANKIGELDRGKLSLWEGDYQSFLAFRERRLADEEKHHAEFDKKLAQEETWIRQGIKARRTRNEGRVRALKKMREERAQRRQVTGNVALNVNQDGLSGKLVAEFKHVSFAYADKAMIKDFSSVIVRGDKIGLIGPNGIGKSTFLKLLQGKLAPQNGTVKLGTNLSVAYFDQLRDQLDEEKTAIDNIAEGREYIDINGKPRHVISYLGDFLFTGEKARTPIKTLSGGERNRILLAKLFSKPANLLIMDEPTNDLDVETLELLESLLVSFDGTLFLVSHDRAFLDNVVTSTIGFEGDGVLKEYIGGYEDWVRQGGRWPESETGAHPSLPAETSSSKTAPVEPNSGNPNSNQKPAKKKLSYKLQRELDTLPAEIERLETDVAELGEALADPNFYSQDADTINQKTAALADKENALQIAYERWETLEKMQDPDS